MRGDACVYKTRIPRIPTSGVLGFLFKNRKKEPHASPHACVGGRKMSFKHEDRQRVISSIWKHGGRKQPAWRLRIDPYQGKDQPPDQGALDDRAKRWAQPETRDATGQILGDPPAGRSALDQKRAAEAEQSKARPWWEIGDGND